MARTKLIAGNWKLNLSIAEGVALVQGLAKTLAAEPRSGTVDVAVCPTSLALAAVATAATGSRIGVGGQNLYWEEKGAFTGELSGSFLKAAGATYVIIGHSERRQFFGETDSTVNKRVKAALTNGLIPLLCVGETLTERDAGKLETVLSTQIKGALEGLQPSQLETLVVAYEPVWAIGTGRTASKEQAQEAHAFIRGLLIQALGALGSRVRILYGGSVKADNAKELLSMPDVDGALVGGASLKSADFSAIILAALG